MSSKPAAETRKRVREAFRTGMDGHLYIMVPAQDGGQTYEMRCQVCGAFGNILASRFQHEDGCPVPAEEAREARRRRGWLFRLLHRR